MKKTYELNNKLIKGLLKENLIFLIGLLVLSLIIFYFRGFEKFKSDFFYLLFILGSTLVLNIPAICLIINYYSQNKDTKLKIDTQSDLIQISQKGKSKTYKLSNIETSVYNIGIYYKNAIDNNARRSAFHSNFGYWDLKFTNGDRYYLSNLIIDFLHQKAFIEITKYRFRFFPYINKSTAKTGIDLKSINIHEKSRVEKFIEQFQSKNENQLLEIIDNKESYQKEALEAAKIVLKNKKKHDNKV